MGYQHRNVIEPLPKRRKGDGEHVKPVISPFGTAHSPEQALEAWQWKAFRLFLSSLVDDEFCASPPCAVDHHVVFIRLPTPAQLITNLLVTICRHVP